MILFFPFQQNIKIKMLCREKIGGKIGEGKCVGKFGGAFSIFKFLESSKFRMIFLILVAKNYYSVKGVKCNQCYMKNIFCYQNFPKKLKKFKMSKSSNLAKNLKIPQKCQSAKRKPNKSIINKIC